MYHVYVIHTITHLAIYVLVARDFYSNGRPVVVLATRFGIVICYVLIKYSGHRGLRSNVVKVETCQ